MTNPTPHGQVPAIQRYKIGYHSDEWGVRSLSPTSIYDDAGPWVRYEDHAAELRRLHDYCQELESQVILDCMTHVQNAEEIEHVAGDVSKNGAELNMTGSAMRASHGQAPAQAAPAAVAGPSEAVAYLDIGAGGYLDLGTDLSNEALSRLPKGRHALVIAGTYGIDGYTAAPNTQPAPDEILNMAREQGLPETETEGVFRVNVDDLGRMFAADRAARAPADSVTAPQQEAQEPVAWYVTGCGRLLDEDEAKAEARHIGGTARAIPLYTAPQADSVQDLQPVHDAVTIDLLNERVEYLERKLKEADSVPEGAALLKEARDALWQPANVELCERIDAYLDAARKQGANHD